MDAVITVFAVFVVVSYSSFIAYAPSDKTLRLALGVMMLSALVSFFSSFSFDLILPDTDADDFSELSELHNLTVEEAFADGVALAVADKFGFSRADISVDAVRVSEDLTAEEIRLTLRGKASLADTRGIRSYLIENGICDRAEIIIFGS